MMEKSSINMAVVSRLNCIKMVNSRVLCNGNGIKKAAQSVADLQNARHRISSTSALCSLPCILPFDYLGALFQLSEPCPQTGILCNQLKRCRLGIDSTYSKPCSAIFDSPLQYAYPLALYVETFYPVLNTKGANVIENDNTTSSASGASLVRPNANYVYSRIAVDLSHYNVNISLPNVTDRPSFVYPFYDL